jgi:hypothetical protein
MKNILNQEEKVRSKLNKSVEEDQIGLLSQNIGLYSLGNYSLLSRKNTWRRNIW